MSDMPLFSVQKKCRWIGWSLVSGSAFTEKAGQEFIETLLRVERENELFAPLKPEFPAKTDQ